MRESKNAVWGSFLILVGVLLPLERSGWLHVPHGSAWPLILFAFAADSAIDRRITRAIVLTLLGAIALCASFSWLGLSYTHSWPLLLVAAGIAIVINALTGGPRRRGTREVSQ